MKADDSLFAGADVWVASRAPADAMVAFARRFGAGNVQALRPAQPGPDPVRFSQLAGELITAGLDGAVLFSAAGTQRLIEAASSLPDPARFIAALDDCRLLVAGPRAARVLRRRGISGRFTLDDAGDWRKLVTGLEQMSDLAQSRLVVESTRHDLALRAALESRGVVAEVIPLAAAPLNPIKASPGTMPAAPGMVLLTDLEGLAGMTGDAGSLPTAQNAAPVFTADPDLVELAGVLGFEPRLIKTRRPPEEWSTEEAWQIAAQSW
jgi:hypothetical protein